MARLLVSISWAAAHCVSSIMPIGGSGHCSRTLMCLYDDLFPSGAAALRFRIGSLWRYCGGSTLGEREQICWDSGDL